MKSGESLERNIKLIRTTNEPWRWRLFRIEWGAHPKDQPKNARYKFSVSILKRWCFYGRGLSHDCGRTELIILSVMFSYLDRWATHDIKE